MLRHPSLPTLYRHVCRDMPSLSTGKRQIDGFCVGRGGVGGDREGAGREGVQVSQGGTEAGWSSSAELAERLEAHGLKETEDISAKLARGTFAATFFLAVMAALELIWVDLNAL